MAKRYRFPTSGPPDYPDRDPSEPVKPFPKRYLMRDGKKHAEIGYEPDHPRGTTAQCPDCHLVYRGGPHPNEDPGRDILGPSHGMSCPRCARKKGGNWAMSMLRQLNERREQQGLPPKTDDSDKE